MAANQASVDVVIYSVGASNPRPWAVALNEVCINQGGQIENALAGFGYAVVERNFVRTKAASSSCSGLDFGNVIFVRGANTSHSFVNLSQDPNDVAGEVRKGICNRAETFFGPIAACAVHFTKNSGGWAQQQANETLFIVGAAYPNTKKWVAGDFNMRPPGPFGGTPVPLGWYQYYYEADVDQDATRDSGIKNDFIFGAKDAFVSGRDGVPIPVSSSDHHYFKAVYFD